MIEDKSETGLQRFLWEHATKLADAYEEEHFASGDGYVGGKAVTDLQRFINLYASFGIKCKVTSWEGKPVIYLSADGRYGDTMDTTTSEKLDGHSGFFSTVEFTEDGEFVKQGFWE